MGNYKKSIGIFEYMSVAAGMESLNEMVKNWNVEIVFAEVVDSGKYIIVLSGRVSDIKSIVDRAHFNKTSSFLLKNDFIGNPDSSIIKSIKNKLDSKSKFRSLGILESYSISSLIRTADIVVKSTPAEIIKIKLGNNMDGRAYAIFEGELSSIEMSLELARINLIKTNSYYHSCIISSPSKEFIRVLS